ncbi:MAG: 3',5'-cyclic-nucleotide phosphodiesterase [Acidobacteriota bacterium]|nr:3',5'-cyclic-nucleotide phosphodiesterase [Acidobacteriota bacterium]
MKIRVLGSYGGENAGSRMTCLLINDRVALDAGSLSQALTIEEQVAVHSIVLTHSHMDHTNSLPFFIENVFGKTDQPIHIYASVATIYAIRKYLFNNEVWPDFSRLPNHLLPSVQFHEIEADEARTIGDVTFTPVPVNHVVPTFGYLIEAGGSSVLWSSDTGPTQRLWEIANQRTDLKAICLETSFDNSMQEVADLSLHLTPRSMAEELAKLERDVPVYLHHIKPPCASQIRREVAELKLSNVHFLEQGKTYDFS